MPQCPKCSGEMFDESKSKYWNGGKTREGKDKPLYKCKNKGNCDGVIWAPKQDSKPQQQATGSGTVQPTIGAPLAPVYGDCMDIASRAIAHYCKAVGVTPTAEAIVAGAATIFIQASQSGRPVKAAKPKPAPEPEQSPEYSSRDGLQF